MIPIRPLLSLLSPAGGLGHLSVLIFHRVLPQPDPIFPTEVDAIQFDKMMGWVKSWFNVLPLDEAVQRLKTSTLPKRAAAITFDDGYLDNFTVALPILKRHGLSSTFFIATGFVDGGRMWNDTVIESIRTCQLPILDLTAIGLGSYPIVSSLQKNVAIGTVISQIKYLSDFQRIEITEKIAYSAQVKLPDNLMMTSGQIRDMHRVGMQIGAHTVNHPILSKIDLADARREIADSKIFLESLLKTKISLFAYPNGKPGTDYLPAHPPMVKDLGFDAAVSTHPGAANHKSDLFQIPRFTPWDRSELYFGARLLRNLHRA